MTTNTSDVDAIFELAADSATSAQDTSENGTQTAAAATSAATGTGVYPNVLRTYKASEVGEGNPEGTLTIAEFAGHLTLEAVRAGAGLEGIVDKATIYTGVRGSRHPLPVVLVYADDDDQSDQKTAKVYLPVAEASAVYKSRPTRGEGGNSSTSKRTLEELLDDAAKKAVTLAKTQKRFDRVKSQLDTVAAQFTKYHGWLTPHFLGSEILEIEETDEQGNVTKRPETQEEANKRALNDAIAERAAKIEEEEALKADAAKNSDIPDAE